MNFRLTKKDHNNKSKSRKINKIIKNTNIYEHVKTD